MGVSENVEEEDNIMCIANCQRRFQAYFTKHVSHCFLQILAWIENIDTSGRLQFL